MRPPGVDGSGSLNQGFSPSSSTTPETQILIQENIETELGVTTNLDSAQLKTREILLNFRTLAIDFLFDDQLQFCFNIGSHVLIYASNLLSLNSSDFPPLQSFQSQVNKQEASTSTSVSGVPREEEAGSSISASLVQLLESRIEGPSSQSEILEIEQAAAKIPTDDFEVIGEILGQESPIFANFIQNLAITHLPILKELVEQGEAEQIKVDLQLFLNRVIEVKQRGGGYFTNGTLEFNYSI
jgi:hypothetical protein